MSFLSLIRRHQYQFGLYALLGLFNALLSVYLVDLLSISSTSESANSPMHWLLIFMGLLLTLFIGLNLNTYLTTQLGVQIRHHLRDQITRQTLNTRYETIRAMGNHKIYATLTKDIDDISTLISEFPFFMHQFLILSCCIGFMAYKSWLLFSVPCVIFCLNILFMSYLMKQDYAYCEAHREKIDDFNADIKTMVDGAKELSQSYARNQSFYQHHAAPSLAQLRDSDFKQEIYSCLVDNWSEISTFLALGSVLFVHLFLGVGTSADVLTFTFIFFYIQGPVGSVTYAKETLIKAKVGLQSIQNLGLGALEPDDAKPQHFDLKPWQQIRYERLTYQYPNGDAKFSIKPISFHVNSGEIVFLRGKNGSGKSTFTRLMTGLLTPSTGQIMLDGQSVNSSDWRFKSLFGVVHTNSCLFHEVVDQAGHKVTEKAVVDFLKLMHLEDKVELKNGQLSTLDLSQGQQKRLALLLAYFENAPILVLDEFAADQDPEFRKYFYEVLIHHLRAQGKTIVAVTHDDAYFHYADRLFVMTEGELKEDTVTRTSAAQTKAVLGEC